MHLSFDRLTKLWPASEPTPPKACLWATGRAPTNFWWVVTPDSQKKPGPISDQKMSFPHPFSDLEEVTERNIHVYIDRNYNIITQIRAPTNSHIMGLFPINVEPIEKICLYTTVAP